MIFSGGRRGAAPVRPAKSGIYCELLRRSLARTKNGIRMDRATSLIEQIQANPSDLGGVANELLSEYYRGSDVSSLWKLLHSEDDRIADCGTWIAGELAEVGKPLLPELRHLLGHRSKGVRFWAIECVREWAGPPNPEELALAVSLVGDSEEGVRWKAMEFLALATRAQLEAADVGFKITGPRSPCSDDLRWMLSPSGADPDQIADALEGSQSSRRKFAAAAAFRIARSDPGPLQQASSSSDSEVARFADDMRKRISAF